MSRLFKLVVFLGCLAPAAGMAYQLYGVATGEMPEALGVDPVKTLEHQTGLTSLTILFITLTVTPLRRLSGWNRLQSVRRMLGVWSFVYAVLHVAAYLVFDRSCYSFGTCNFSEVAVDVLSRKYIFVGMVSFTILLALAVTSTGGWVRRLKKRWTTLHRLVYVAAIAAIFHFIWIQKSDLREPMKWAAVLAVLLGIRVYFALRKRSQKQTVKA
jgi:sulfoxide reductase heme-binding subunit YedZ